jgi:hypothetical protein
LEEKREGKGRETTGFLGIMEKHEEKANHKCP